MRKFETKLLLVLLMVAVMSATACCSGIVKRESWTPEIANTGWVQFDSYHDTDLKFQHGNVAITVGYYDERLQVVWLGPPLFPIIPLFRQPLPFRSWSFWLSVKVESPTDTTTMDFSETRLWISKDKSVPLSYLKAAYEYDKQYPNIVERYQELQEQKVVISHGKLDFVLNFHPFDSDAEEQEFLINLGSVEVDGNEIKLPPIKCRKTFRYKYLPLTLPEHGIP